MNRHSFSITSIASLTALTAISLAGLAATQDTKPAPKPATAPAVVATPTASAEGVRAYNVDDIHSSAMFRVLHAGAGQFWGRFNGIAGTFTLADDASKSAFSITVDVASVDTSVDQLDGHLKGADFFNVAEFPTMSFSSRSTTSSSTGVLEISGDLTLHGVTKPVTAVGEITGVSDMSGTARAGVEVVFTIKRSDFGMNYGVAKGMLGDSVRILVNIEGVQAK